MGKATKDKKEKKADRANKAVDDAAEPEESKPVLKCPGCGDLMVNVVSGAVCPTFKTKACGGIFPPITPEQHKLAVKMFRMGSMPQARRLGIDAAEKGDEYSTIAVYGITDKQGIFRRVVKRNSLNGDVLAVTSDAQVLRFRPWAHAEAQLLKLCGLTRVKSDEDQKEEAETVKVE